MISKKSESANLESKRSLFFMIGMALALLFCLAVFQYSKVVSVEVPSTPLAVIETGEAIPITRIERAEPTKREKKIKKFNHNLPPEVVEPEVTLDVSELFTSSELDDSLAEIGIDDFNEEDIETIDYIALEFIAVPFECKNSKNVDEQKACFNGWVQRFIAQNTNYPELAKQMNLQGKVFVTFVISEKGIVEGVELAHGEYEVLNNEALRVVESFPEMTPARQQGKKVKMKMTVPVNFKLSGR